ncbi:MAG: archaeosortase/exosortase family protein [Burkholderiales bacterium]|nr:archaeosortase/exosortase family protein [Burkholderiales bacterium]
MTVPTGPGSAGVAPLRRVGAFLLLFTVLQALYGAAAGTWVERLVIDEATVKVAAALIRLADPGVGVVASGPSLKAPGGGLNVRNGCEGIDVAFLLASAMLVAPLAWRARLAGLAAALALTYVLNQGRVLALFYAYRLDRAWFDALHGYVGPLVLIAVAGAFFAFWVRRFGAVRVEPAGAH